MPGFGRQPRSNLCVYYAHIGGRTHLGESELLPKVNNNTVAITKQKKQEILERLAGIKDTAEAIVFVNFNAMPVQNSTAMRAAMREAGVTYFVAKKTLIKRAFDGAFTGELPQLDGEIALAYSDDPITPAQKVKEFADTYKENIAIVGGVFQGAYKSREEMTEIASIPPLPVLHGMFANFLQQPVQGIALAIQAVAEAKQAQAA